MRKEKEVLKLDLVEIVPYPWLSKFEEVDVFTDLPSTVVTLMKSGCNKIRNALVIKPSMVNETLRNYVNYATNMSYFLFRSLVNDRS